MTDLKKLAAEMRQHKNADCTAPCVRLLSNPTQCSALYILSSVSSKWADALDAYADAQKPVAKIDRKYFNYFTWLGRRATLPEDGTLLYAAPPPAKPASVCAWECSADPDVSFWDTSCGEAWTFITDGPKENGMKFCPYCGGTLEITVENDK